MRLALLSVLLVLPLAAQTSPTPALPQSSAFVLAGYGTKINGAMGYAQLLSQASQTYSYTSFRYVPQRGTLLAAPLVMTGAAVHLRDMSWLSVYALGQGGASSTSTGTLGAFSVGGIGIISPPKWKRIGIVLGADMQKTASGAAYPNFDIGLIIKQ